MNNKENLKNILELFEVKFTDFHINKLIGMFDNYDTRFIYNKNFKEIEKGRKHNLGVAFYEHNEFYINPYLCTNVNVFINTYIHEYLHLCLINLGIEEYNNEELIELLTPMFKEYILVKDFIKIIYEDYEKTINE